MEEYNLIRYKQKNITGYNLRNLMASPTIGYSKCLLKNVLLAIQVGQLNESVYSSFASNNQTND